MKDFAEKINKVHNRFTDIQLIFAEISIGNTSSLEGLVKIKKRSEADKIMPSIIATLNTIKDLINESNLLVEAGINGNLQVRGDEFKFKGRYKEIISGFNKTLNAMEKPINEASDVLEKIAARNLTTKMEGDYLGSY